MVSDGARNCPLDRLILVLQVPSDTKSPDEDKREDAADDTRVVCAHGPRRMVCATYIALPSRLVGKKRRIGNHARITRSGHILRG